MQKTVRNRNLHPEDFDIHGDIERIKSALADVTHDVKGKASSMLLQSMDDARQKATAARENAIDYVTEKPLRSLGFAVLTGALIGFLLRK